MRRIAIAGVMLSVLLSGCSNPLGLRDPDDVSVSFYAEQALAAGMRLRVDFGDEIIQLVSQGGGATASVKTHVPRYGRVPVRVVLLRPSGDSLARVEFTQEFRRGENHWVHASLVGRRPTGHCFGSLEVAPLRAPVSAEASDTLFVTHGSIPEGIIC